MSEKKRLDVLLTERGLQESRQRAQAVIMSGEVVSPINPKPGCRFAARCPYADEKCRTERPVLEEGLPEHFAACHHVKEINRL